MKKFSLTLILVLALLLVVQTHEVSAAWYINSTHSNCSDANALSVIDDPSSPLCTVNQGLTTINSPGVIYVQGVSNDTNTFDFDTDQTGQQWIGVGIDHAKLQGFNQDIFVIGDNDWTNVTSSFTGRPVFMLNSGILTHTTTSLSMHYSNGSGILKCQSQSELNDSTVLGGCYWWNSTGSDLYVSAPPGGIFNANSISFKVSTGILVYISGADDLNISGFTIDGGTEGVLISGTGTDNITIQGSYTVNTKSDKGAISAQNAGTNIWIINNTCDGMRPYAANWDDQKNTLDDGNEHSCFWGQNLEAGTRITGNYMYRVFNGIYLEGSTARPSSDAFIDNNYIIDTYDDSLELENYADAWVVSNNQLYNAYVGFSISPFYSLRRSFIVNNTIVAPRVIVETGTPGDIARGPGFKAVGYTPAPNGNKSVHNLTIASNTIYTNVCFNSRTSSTEVYWDAWVNTTIIDNICYTNNSDFVLNAIGLYSSNNHRDNNLYWRIDANADIARFYDGGSSASVNLTEMQSQQPNWDQNSIWEDPLFPNAAVLNFTPTGNACNASSTGGTLGDPRWSCFTTSGGGGGGGGDNSTNSTGSGFVIGSKLSIFSMLKIRG